MTEFDTLELIARNVAEGIRSGEVSIERPDALKRVAELVACMYPRRDFNNLDTYSMEVGYAMAWVCVEAAKLEAEKGD